MLSVSAVISDSSSETEILPLKSDNGAFSVDNSKNVLLYYASQNNLTDETPTYSATMRYGQIKDLVRLSTTNAFKYTDVVERDVVIYIQETLKNGSADFPSYWRVPKKAQRCAAPENVTFNGNLIEWNEPKAKILSDGEKIVELNTIRYCPQVTSYTVFWCAPGNRTNSLFQCEGPIQFERIPVTSNITSYSHNLNDTRTGLNFAVSANSQDSSSGMVWAEKKIIDKIITTK